MQQRTKLFMRMTNSRVATLSAALGVAFVLLTPHLSIGVTIGSNAPDFSMQDMKGNAITLSAMRKKAVLLTFWAPWCVPCKDELPEFERLYTNYRDKGFMVIAISVETSARGVSSFLKTVPVTFPVVIDANGQTAESYRITGLPASFLVDKSGIVRKRYWGYIRNTLSGYETDIKNLLIQQ